MEKSIPASWSPKNLMLLILTWLLIVGGANAEAQQKDPAALLKAMSDYVGNQKTIALTFDSDIEVITPALEKIQFTNSGKAILNRPDKLRAYRYSGYSDVELIFNGETANIYSSSLNGYAKFDVPGTIDQLFHALRAGHGVALPAADLLLTNSYDTLIADVIESKYMGRGIIDGRECHHLAFRNMDVDWQLWIEVGNPVPRKMVITSKAINSAPQYTLRLTSWKTGIKFKENIFNFVPPQGASKLLPEQLIHLDELPPDTASGEY